MATTIADVTSFQRRRRWAALIERAEELEIDHSVADGNEAALRQIIADTESGELSVDDASRELDELLAENTDDDAVVRAKARELGVKSWHLKSIDNLKAEITDIEAESSKEVTAE